MELCKQIQQKLQRGWNTWDTNSILSYVHLPDGLPFRIGILGAYVLPSIAKNDPAFPDQDYWRGRVWGPMNYLVYEAFRQKGLRRQCAELADRSCAMFMKEWTEKGHVHKNYSAVNGRGDDVANSDKFYHWGGLMGFVKILDQMAIEN